MRKLLLCTVFVGGAASAAEPIEEIVVTASRVPMSLRTVGSAIDVLTAEDIETRPRFNVGDLLREVPSVAVNRAGGLGGLTQIRIRGAEANHTVVLIDGVQVGDPFNNSEFDFGNLLTSGLARIEVLRGPQSALYGAQAIGGVVNVITTLSDGPPAFTAEGQGGSYGTYGVNGAASGGNSKYRLGAAAAYLSTEGVSQSRRDPEKDGHHNLTLNAIGHADLSDVFSVSTAVRYMDSFKEFDAQDFTFGSPTYGLVIDSDETQTTKTFSGHVTGKLSLNDGAWTHRLTTALTKVRSRTNAFGAFSFGSNGRKLDVVYQTDATFDTDTLSHGVTGAVEYRHERYEALSGFPGPQNQTRTMRTWGFVGEYRLGIADQVFLSGSLRHDDNEFFVNATTYRVTAAWAIPESPVKIRASFGTGVSKPGFYELFGFDPTTFRGNPNLKPEQSRGWDLGTDVTLGDRGLFSISYFDSNLRNQITTDFSVVPFTTRNLAGISHRKGLETALRYDPLPALSLAATYTYTKSTDDRGLLEFRRPKHIASLSATGKLLNDRLRLGASLDYNGKQDDVVFVPSIPSGRTVLDSYTLVTVNAAYDVTERVQIFGRIDNLLDEKYQEVFSFNSLGRGAYAGIRVKLGG